MSFILQDPCGAKDIKGLLFSVGAPVAGFHTSLSNLRSYRLGLSNVFFSILCVVFAQVNRREDGFFKTAYSGRGRVRLWTAVVMRMVIVSRPRLEAFSRAFGDPTQFFKGDVEPDWQKVKRALQVMHQEEGYMPYMCLSDSFTVFWVWLDYFGMPNVFKFFLPLAVSFVVLVSRGDCWLIPNYS